MPFQKGHKINTGRKFSEEHKRNIGEANKGNISWCKGKHLSREHGENISKTLKGRKLSEEHKRNISKAKKGKMGKNSGNWRGGITPINQFIRNSNKMKEWRKSVFERDNHTCQKCGKGGRDLETHHRKSFNKYPELRFDIDNGIALCKKCHNKIYFTKGKM